MNEEDREKRRRSGYSILLIVIAVAVTVFHHGPRLLPDTGTLTVRDADLGALPPTYALDNTSRRSGDVLGFVELPDGSASCPHVFDMEDETSVDVRFQCDPAPESGAVVRIDWVSSGRNAHLLESAERF